MTRKRSGAAAGLVVCLAAGMLPLVASAASAHPDEKHGKADGHLPAKVENVRLIGEGRVSDRSTATPPPGGLGPLEGRVADVAVSGNFAYLASFREPDCSDGGVFVMDITNPSEPTEVREAFIPTTPGSYVGEGMQVLRIGDRDVLLFNNETCADTGKGGMTLVDVTNPRSPVVLAAHAGDTTGNGTDDNATTPVHEIHSVFGWVNNGRAFAALVDNDEDRDLDIFEITNPSAPVILSETSFIDDERVVQPNPPNGDSQFLHDLVVKRVNGRQTMLASYWDNGYLILDVEDPANPQFLRDTDYAATEPFAARLRLPQGFEPEGNAHQAEFSPDNQFFIGTDEDFNPFRVIARLTSGPNSGTEATATNGGDTPAVTNTRSLTGSTDFVGRGCLDTDSATAGNQSDPYPTKAGDIAIIERGLCTFQEKYDRAVAAGYTGVVVFNARRADCDALLSPSVRGQDVPFVFVDRATGLRMLNQTLSADPCTQAAPPIGGETADVDIRGVFDSWGYVHLYDASTMADLGQYAIDEALDPAFATGFGDLSVHEVAMDPKVQGRAYLSYYSGGFRVVEYDRSGIREVGAFVSGDGSNLWGVEFWTSPTTGDDYVLASDRNGALQIFQYVPGATRTSPGPSGSATPQPSGPPAGNQCQVAPSVTVERSTITATGSTGVTVRAAPNSVVDLLAYTRPSSTFRVVRSAEIGADGVAQFRIAPPANTRLYAQQRGCPDADPARTSVVVNVRTALSLNVTRTGPRAYTFSGDSLPARAGGLIVSLYRVTPDGRQVLTAQTRADATTGEYRMARRFTGSGRFGFVVRTGQDLQNAPGASNVRSVLVF